MIVYLIGCQICGGQYTDSTKKKGLGLGKITIKVHTKSL